ATCGQLAEAFENSPILTAPVAESQHAHRCTWLTSWPPRREAPGGCRQFTGVKSVDYGERRRVSRGGQVIGRIMRRAIASQADARPACPSCISKCSAECRGTRR